MATGGAMVRESTYPMVEVDAAVATVLSFASDDLGEEMVGLDAVEGRVLHGDVVATQDVPPFRASVKDGYAVVQAEGAGTFEVSGEVTAGKPPGVPVGGGKVAYVTTGAPVPDEADAVVQVEWTRAVEGRDGLVEITTPAPKVGHDIRKVGADIARGQTILRAREVVHMAEIGLLATCNVGEVPVFRRPVVGILSTGDELLGCGSEMVPGTIIDSNRPMLLAAVRAAGGDAADLGIARDEREHVEASFRRAIETTDVLVTSGGVSMGNRDFVKPLLEEYGKVHFGRVLMKPGKPLTFATIEPDSLGPGVPSTRKLAIGLPGNPVSCFVCFHLVVAPLIRKMLGIQSPHYPVVEVTTEMELKLDPQRPEYHRATIQWDTAKSKLVARSTGLQASSRLLSARSANGLLLLPQSSATLPPGEVVKAMILGPIL